MRFRADIAVGVVDAGFATAYLATRELLPALIMGGVASAVLFLMFLQHWFFSLHEERPQPERCRLVLSQFAIGILRLVIVALAVEQILIHENRLK